MKRLKEVLQSDVWQHWKKVENLSGEDFRSDIRKPLPKDLIWYLAEIEKDDLDQLFIISSSDWTDISDGTFRVLKVVDRLNPQSNNSDTKRISEDIQEKMKCLDDGGDLDTCLIAVTDSKELAGPFTFIEGNRRCVTFCKRNEIVGCQIYVGFSPGIRNYSWASQSFRESK